MNNDFEQKFQISNLLTSLGFKEVSSDWFENAERLCIEVVRCKGNIFKVRFHTPDTVTRAIKPTMGNLEKIIKSLKGE